MFVRSVLVWAVAICSFACTQALEAASSTPNAKDLFASYQRSFDRLRTIHFKGRTELEFKGDFKNSLSSQKRGVLL